MVHLVKWDRKYNFCISIIHYHDAFPLTQLRVKLVLQELMVRMEAKEIKGSVVPRLANMIYRCAIHF